MDNIREAVEVLEEIMIDEDIRDALEVLEGIFEWKETTHNSDSYGQKGLATAIEVLKQYLSIEGFPEELEGNYQGMPYQLGCQDGYNLARRDCKLALMKMFSEGDIKWCIDRLNESVLYVRNEKNKEYRFNNEAIVHLNIIQRVQGVLGAIHNLTNGGLK